MSSASASLIKNVPSRVLPSCCLLHLKIILTPPEFYRIFCTKQLTPYRSHKSSVHLGLGRLVIDLYKDILSNGCAMHAQFGTACSLHWQSLEGCQSIQTKKTTNFISLTTGELGRRMWLVLLTFLDYSRPSSSSTWHLAS